MNRLPEGQEYCYYCDYSIYINYRRKVRGSHSYCIFWGLNCLRIKNLYLGFDKHIGFLPYVYYDPHHGVTFLDVDNNLSHEHVYCIREHIHNSCYRRAVLDIITGQSQICGDVRRRRHRITNVAKQISEKFKELLLLLSMSQDAIQT